MGWRFEFQLEQVYIRCKDAILDYLNVVSEANEYISSVFTVTSLALSVDNEI
jgi:hypothetical protein